MMATYMMHTPRLELRTKNCELRTANCELLARTACLGARYHLFYQDHVGRAVPSSFPQGFEGPSWGECSFLPNHRSVCQTNTRSILPVGVVSTAIHPGAQTICPAASARCGPSHLNVQF